MKTLDLASPYFILARVWRRQSANRFHQMFQQSRLMLAVIGTFVVGYWVFFTWAFHRGIYFMQYGIPGLGDLLISRMFYVLFAALFFMLVTSSAIVGYGVFFKNRETAWLQTLPIPHGTLFRWKFIEMSILASWAFVFLSGPLFLAYGLVLRLSLAFYIGVMVMYLPFSLLANALGAAIILFLVRLWHSRMGKKLIIGSACLALVLGFYFFKPVDVGKLQEAEIIPLINILLKNTRVSALPILPSYWLASSVLGLADQLWIRPIFFFAVTLSYASLVGWLVLRYSGQLFYDDTSCVQDRRLHGRARTSRTFVSPQFWVGRILLFPLFWLKPPVRIILIKDWVTFWRDTAQWSQFAIFFGLLGFYFLNLKNFRYHLDDRFWVSAIAFLNMASLGLILSTLTTRFIFPQFSLEGRRLWLVGLAPTTLRQVVWGKFWSSTMLSGGITVVLMLFCFSSLNLDPALRKVIAFTVVMLAVGLNGIAVGTGVLFPNLKQSSATEIVSGFGGTFCLVLSLAYVALMVIGVSIPMHLRYMAKLPLEFDFTTTVGMVYTMSLAVSLVATMVPMGLAERKLNRLEI